MVYNANLDKLKLNYQIINQIGNKVQVGEIEGREIINISTLKPAVYFMKLSDGSKVGFTKFIKL